MAAAAVPALLGEDPELERVFRGHRGAVASVFFCRDQVVSGGMDGHVMVWHLGKRNMRAFRYIGHQGPVLSVAYNGTHNLIATASQDATVRLWKPSAEGRSTVLKAHTAAVRCCAFSHNGHMLATASDDKTVKIWSVPEQRFLQTLLGHNNWVRSCQLSPDARLAVSGGDDRRVMLWDMETRAVLHVFEELDGSPNVVRFHPDGNCIASGCTDGSIKLWDLRCARIIQYYEAHGAPGAGGTSSAVTDCCFHPSGSFLLSTGMDGTLKIHDLQEGQLYYTLHGHEGPTRAAAFSEAGDRFVSAGADKQVLVWRTNFDSCLAEAVHGTAVCTTDRTAAKRRPGSQRGPGGGAASARPVAVGRTDCSRGAGLKPAALSQAAVMQQGTAPSSIAAARPMQRVAGDQQCGSGLEASEPGGSSLVPSSGEPPEGVAGVLQTIVAQLDMLTQTVAAMEERLTISEDCSRRLEAVVALLAQQQGQQGQGGGQQGQQEQGGGQQGQQQPLQSINGVGTTEVAS